MVRSHLKRMKISVYIATLMVSIATVLHGGAPVYAAPLIGTPATYTLTADFGEGSGINVVYDNDQVQLDDTTEAFKFIWVAASARGTIVKIDTTTGVILGEYRSAPDGRGKNPSRTTVDANGSVWAGNRAEFTDTGEGLKGSVVHIGLLENGQCEDRNGNGTIETSTGLGDIKLWSNAGNADDNGGVSTADDECIIHYVRTLGTGLRTLAVDANNNVWAGGFSNQVHELIDGSTGVPIPGTDFDKNCGGYGGLMDPNGILWAAGRNRGLLRYDPSTGDHTCYTDRGDYGLGIDPNTGHIWHSSLSSAGLLYEIDADGTVLNSYSQPFSVQGVVVDSNSHVWIAELFGDEVAHYAPDPNNSGQHIHVGNVSGLTGTTGVAVGADGFIWASEYNSSDSRGAAKIDPNAGPIGAGGYPIGAVVQTIGLGDDARPYNYSDMTGSTVIAPPGDGTWSVTHDTAISGAEWGYVSWNAAEPGDSSIIVTAASSDDGVTFGPAETVTSGADLSVANGRYIKVTVSFSRSTNSDANGDGIYDSPILFDLTIAAITNESPVCDNAMPSVDMLWPPNHKFAPVNILGVSDPDGDPLAITINSIYQDEPVDTFGDGQFSPDGQGVGTDTAEVRAERIGSKKVPGNGRVYHIGFTADDGQGNSCSGVVAVGVPHDQGKGAIPIDEGALYDSTVP